MSHERGPAGSRASLTSNAVLPIAILASGSGSNLQALLDAAAADAGFGAEPVLVLSDRSDAKALDRAAGADVPTAVVEWDGDRASFTRRVCDTAEAAGAETMVLAGFMRILGPAAIERFPLRILNIHPALLPAFRGAHAIPDALAAGVKVTGVTVHFVDEQVDHGPIICQEAVEVLDDDDESTLHARIQEVEHRLYPAAVKAFATGRLDVRGNKVVWT